MKMSDEVSKLQTHLSLLRDEYVKLQSRHAELQKKYEIVEATVGHNHTDNFVSRLISTVAQLHDNELYSDLIVQLSGGEVKAHRFVLAARSDNWGVKDLSQVSVLDMTAISHDVAEALLRWVYTDIVNIKADDKFILDLLRASTTFQLTPLSNRCEQALISSVGVRNCIPLYQTADEIGASVLREHCSDLISSHWNDFKSEDFESMPATLVYKMFKAKSEHPLHTAIRTKREDAVFLYLIEYDTELPGKLNEMDSKGDLALDLALRLRLDGIAQTLVQHKVDIDRSDHSGLCLLHKAIKRGDEFAARFLIENGADVNAASALEKKTALHFAAAHSPAAAAVDSVLPSSELLANMAYTTRQLLRHAANVNAQDTAGNTPLHTALLAPNEPAFRVLLEDAALDKELQNADGHTPLWLALQAEPSGDTFAVQLVSRGSSVDAVNRESGDTLLHLAAKTNNEIAGVFLANHGANTNISNHKGEMALHCACESGLSRLALLLLQKGANPNVQTSAPRLAGLDNEDSVHAQTPLHLAIASRHDDVVRVILQFKAEVKAPGLSPSLALADSRGQTALGAAVWQGRTDTARRLLDAGADVDATNAAGETLLHEAVGAQDSDSALFLLHSGADTNARTAAGESCLELAIRRHLPAVVDNLCTKGVAVNPVNQDGDCPLWQALSTGQHDIASVLVKHGCDPNAWGAGPGGCEQSLLHRAIDENNEPVACFLINSMCDVNCCKRVGSGGQGEEECRDGQVALHVASAWGLEKVVQSLIEFRADVNVQDVEGKTPLHIAIENQHQVIIALLMSHPLVKLGLQDRHRVTPFAAAMLTRNNKAAQAILDREPNAAEQLDARGRNFLHLAIEKTDIESVLFLLSVRANVNSPVQDAAQLTPLHLAVKTGSEILVRNMLLAGADVNATTPQKQTPLHLSALHDRAAICGVLLENGASCDALDDSLCNALHIATQHGHLNVVKSLLAESCINAEAINMRGQNPLHLLGQYGKENGAAIFDLFLECMPTYPIDKPDVNGNTVLLLAYRNGNGNLCRAVVRAGARMGVNNKDGVSIFNAPVATKQLLFKLLDMLTKEPPWCDSEHCVECGTKFGIKTRKHHCRHCGRVLCAKCSVKDMPIIKYNIPKPVRICEICFDVLTLGHRF